MVRFTAIGVLACLMLTSVAAESVTVTGILVDKYCWNDLNGVALDTGSNLKLNPSDHTVHCLVEVGVCRNSGYVIVHKKQGASEYEIQYELDDAGNTRARELLYTVPTGERNKPTGYEITLTGTTTEGSNVLTFGDTDSMGGEVPEANGQTVTVTGILVDKYCWNDLGGVALDTKANLKLDPTDHTVHCLVEVAVCRDSGYVIVHKKEGSDEYEIQYELDDAANVEARILLNQVPVGERNAATGYQVTITGTTTADSNVITLGDTGAIAGKVPTGDANAIKQATGVLVATIAVVFALAM
jgi:hypothetical protein